MVMIIEHSGRKPLRCDDSSLYQLRNSGKQQNILPGAWGRVPTGLVLRLPPGVVGLIDLVPMASNEAASVLGGGRLVDSSGVSVSVPVINHGRGMLVIGEDSWFANLLIVDTFERMMGTLCEWRESK